MTIIRSALRPTQRIALAEDYVRRWRRVNGIKTSWSMLLMQLTDLGFWGIFLHAESGIVFARTTGLRLKFRPDGSVDMEETP